MQLCYFPYTIEYVSIVNPPSIRLSIWNDVWARSSQLKMLITVNYSGHGWLKKTELHCNHLKPETKKVTSYSSVLIAVFLTCYSLDAKSAQCCVTCGRGFLLITLGAGRVLELTKQNKYSFTSKRNDQLTIEFGNVLNMDCMSNLQDASLWSYQRGQLNSFLFLMVLCFLRHVQVWLHLEVCQQHITQSPVSTVHLRLLTSV